MTTKQASITFKLDEKEIRKRNKEGMIIGSTKEKGLIIIPDETKILPSKVQIQSFLFQIFKYKNNPAIVISRHMCPTIEHLKILAEYLYSKGYIGYNIQEPLYKMRDDRKAYSRRKFKYRINEAYVKFIGFRMLSIPLKYYIYIFRPILIGILPYTIYNCLHRR
jgi:hypothetical protein